MLEFRNVNLSNQSRIPVHKSSKVGPFTKIIAFLKRKPLHWILKKSQLSALSSGYWSDQVGQNGKSKKSWRLSCKPWRILKVWILKVIMVGGYVLYIDYIRPINIFHLCLFPATASVGNRAFLHGNEGRAVLRGNVSLNSESPRYIEIFNGSFPFWTTW